MPVGWKEPLRNNLFKGCDLPVDQTRCRLAGVWLTTKKVLAASVFSRVGFTAVDQRIATINIRILPVALTKVLLFSA